MPEPGSKEPNALPFVDHHTHLLAVAARSPAGYDLADPASIAAFHRHLAAAGSSPMDHWAGPSLAADLPAAMAEWLSRAAAMGLVQLTEAGMRDWAHWDALEALRAQGPLAVRVRVMVASGVVDLARMDGLRGDDEWLRLWGVKFYADGWLGPRTCACSLPFADTGDTGVLFLDAGTLARRLEPVVEAGWPVATHAIGDRAMDAVLDAYEAVYGGRAGMAAAHPRPRIEHAQLLRADLIDRMADLGVTVCIQPGFAHSDRPALDAALGERLPLAYRWDRLLAAGVDVIAGSDFPIEPLDPAVGLARLTSGPHPLDRATAVRLMTDPR